MGNGVKTRRNGVGTGEKGSLRMGFLRNSYLNREW